MHGLRRAAVLVVLITDGEERLLLTRRTDGLPTHKGQVAFPGGGWEAGDVDAIAAALREAEEEVGLRASAVEVLGLLDDLPTVHGDVAVTPVVARVSRLPALRAEPGEVARIFTIPLSVLRDPGRWRSEMKRFQGRDVPIFYLEHDGEVLWGLSAYVALQLLTLHPGGPPFPVPDPRG